MEINDVKDGAELLLSYGPYAVLALFALLIAPLLTRQCIKIEGEGFDKKLSGGIACGSWLVVVAMITFVTLTWPPTEVHDGTIGILDSNMEVVSIPHTEVDIYIKSNDVGTKSRKNTWNYAMLVKNRIENKNKCARFNVSWNGENDQYYEVDYQVHLSDLIAEHDLQIPLPTPEANNDKFVYLDGKWSNKIRCVGRQVSAGGFFRTAYAANPPSLNTISQQLQSSNKITRGKGRDNMEGLSKHELMQLKKLVPPNSNAKNVINKELARR